MNFLKYLSIGAVAGGALYALLYLLLVWMLL